MTVSSTTPTPRTHATGSANAPSIDAALENTTQELQALRNEVNALRRRDETLNFYMHRLDEEMRLAARLQQDFLPKSLPQIGPIHFHSLFRPAGYVSGDIYDVMRLDENHLGFFIADAVGHGMPAALLTMFIKRALVTKEINADGYRLLPPAEAMSRLNEALVEQDLSQGTFATALYGIINIQTLSITFARGGHPNPLVLRHGGTVEEVASDGPLLGIFSDGEFTHGVAQLSPGDRLFLYSDGIEVAFTTPEAMDTNQWRVELAARQSLRVEEMLTDFSNHLDNEVGSLAPKDDLTIIVLEVR